MINLEVNLAALSGNAGASSVKSQLPALDTQSFTALLSEAISETLSKFGIDPSAIQLTVQDPGSHSVDTRQISAATIGQTAAPPGVPVSSVPPPPPAAPTAPAAPSIPSTPSGANKATQHWYASDPVDDAYWAKQPAAVQQLREIDNMDERKALAAQLASAGYTIDVPIMVWGWDAGKVMQARESYGYTWVPSALQPNVTAAPGISAPGLTPYDPANPPAGSILLS
jgi:hypothetical protein